MAKDFAKAFYKSGKWTRCRHSYISDRIMTDGGVCETCHKVPGYIVHHKITLTEDNIDNPDVSLNHGNMAYVCKECHDKFDGHGLGNKKAALLVDFDSFGQPISLRDIDIPP